MDKGARVLMAAASGLLVALYFVPLWRIQLIAPQYPEGLRMIVWLNRIAGGNPNDIYNINVLNQYIGMKEINAATIHELKVLPVFVGVMIVFGLFAAFKKKRILPVVWVSVLAIAGAGAFTDFYFFEYDYGHNLNPQAPIKVPGMTYQPPFVGTKQLLNMTASSYPEIGFYIAVLALVLGIVSIILSFKGKGPSGMKSLLAIIFVGGGLSLLLASCAVSGPSTVNYGKDQCAHCSMMIVEPRYWAQVVTDKGKVYFFDSITCLCTYIRERQPSGISSLWVSDFLNPDTAIDARKAVYLYDPRRHGPMGAFVGAFKTRGDMNSVKGTGGQSKSWTELKVLVETKWQR